MAINTVVLAVAALLLAATAAGAPAGAVTHPPNTYNCTAADRLLLNAAGLPYCIRVGILKRGVAESEYYTHELPLRIWNAAMKTVRAIDANITVTYVETEYDHKQGLVATENGEFDAFVADTWILQSRLQHADFSAAYKIESMALMYLTKSAKAYSVEEFLKPFHWSLWLAIAAMFFVAAAALAITELAHEEAKHAGDGIGDRNDIFGSFKKALFHCLNAPYGTQEALPVTAPGRIIMWQVSVFFLIILASYTANLASFLTVAATTPPVTAAELMKYPIMVPEASDADIFIKAHGGTTIAVNVAEATPLGLKNNLYGARSVGEAEHDTIIATRQDPACSVSWVAVDIEVDSAIAFRQHAPVTSLKRVVDATIMGMKESGVLVTWNGAGLPVNQCAPESLAAAEMNFAQTAGVFYTCFVIFGVTLLWSGTGFAMARARGEPARAPAAESEIADTKDDAPGSPNPIKSQNGAPHGADED
jgi:hypothetical protein